MTLCCVIRFIILIDFHQQQMNTKANEVWKITMNTFREHVSSLGTQPPLHYHKEMSIVKQNNQACAYVCLIIHTFKSSVSIKLQYYSICNFREKCMKSPPNVCLTLLQACTHSFMHIHKRQNSTHVYVHS